MSDRAVGTKTLIFYVLASSQYGKEVERGPSYFFNVTSLWCICLQMQALALSHRKSGFGLLMKTDYFFPSLSLTEILHIMNQEHV